MKKLYFLSVLLFSLVALAQEPAEDFEFKKRNVYLRLDLIERITPYAKYSGSIYGTGAIINRDFQNSGLALGYRLQYFFTDNLSVNFGNSFKYEVIVYDYEIADNTTSMPAKKSILIDTHFELTYYLKLFKKGKFHFTLGITAMNEGSQYTITSPYFDENGEILAWGTSQNDFRFSTNKFEIGYNYKRADFAIGTLYKKETPYNDFINPTYFPYIKLGYNIFKF